MWFFCLLWRKYSTCCMLLARSVLSYFHFFKKNLKIFSKRWGFLEIPSSPFKCNHQGRCVRVHQGSSCLESVHNLYIGKKMVKGAVDSDKFHVYYIYVTGCNAWRRWNNVSAGAYSEYRVITYALLLLSYFLCVLYICSWLYHSCIVQ